MSNDTVLNSLQTKYPWAANKYKLERAVNEVLNSGVKETEEAVKAVYERLLGKVLKINSEGKKVDDVNYEEMTLAELKSLARLRKIKISGLSKDELIEELKKPIDADPDDDDEDVVVEDTD